MLKELKMFTIVCDGCGKDVNDDTEYSGWNDVDYLEEIRYEADWGKVDDKHYCTDCFERDDDYEIVIKNKE